MQSLEKIHQKLLKLESCNQELMDKWTDREMYKRHILCKDRELLLCQNLFSSIEFETLFKWTMVSYHTLKHDTHSMMNTCNKLTNVKQ